MDAMTQMAAALCTTPKTKEELRREKNRRYYQKVRDVHQWRWKLQRLAVMRALFQNHGEVAYAYH